MITYPTLLPTRPLGTHRSCKRSRILPCSGSHAGCPTASYNWTPLTLATIPIIFWPLLAAFAQELTPTPTPQIAGEPVATTFQVIVTGSNIPTAEEVGPQPVDTYRRDEIFRLGVRSATDFVQTLPMATGASINENVNTRGNGQTEIDLRGLGPKETLVLQDGRRLAPNGFARYTVG